MLNKIKTVILEIKRDYYHKQWVKCTNKLFEHYNDHECGYWDAQVTKYLSKYNDVVSKLMRKALV